MRRLLALALAIVAAATGIGSNPARAQAQPEVQRQLPGDQPTPDPRAQPIVRSESSRSAEDAKLGDRQTRFDIEGATSLQRIQTRVESRLATRLEQRLTREKTVIENDDAETDLMTAERQRLPAGAYPSGQLGTRPSKRVGTRPR